MKEKLIIIAFVILFLGSGVVLLTQTVKTLPKINSFSFRIPSTTEIIQSIEKWVQSVSPPPTPSIIPSPNPSKAPTKSPVQKQTYQPPPVACYRYKIPHLDGSSSNLCYSTSDFQTLQNLGYEYSGAKTFYEFHLKGVEDYQKQYEKTGSSIYLDAKKSQQDKANEQKAVMDSTLVKMYTIEQRGK